MMLFRSSKKTVVMIYCANSLDIGNDVCRSSSKLRIHIINLQSNYVKLRGLSDAK
jgi:hypothetical protein